MNEYRLNLRDFYNTLLVLIELHNVNIITSDELRHIEGMMRVKYGINDHSVFSLNTLLSKFYYANMNIQNRSYDGTKDNQI